MSSNEEKQYDEIEYEDVTFELFLAYSFIMLIISIIIKKIKETYGLQQMVII
jgi:hypothetical protein